MFCVRCGKEGVAVRGMCIECFLNGKEIVTLPHHVDLERCTNCEEYFLNGQWKATDLKDAIEESTIQNLSIIRESSLVSVAMNTQELDPRNFRVIIEADTETDGYDSNNIAETTVRLKNTVCKRCSRQLGNYYEATLQIRSSERNLSDDMRDEIVRRIRDHVEAASKNNRGLFITKVEEVPGGVDLLLSSISMGRTLARDIADSYGGEYKESSKLVGKTDDGNDMYRLTYLVRLPGYNVGDIVSFNDETYRLNWIGKNGGKLTRLKDLRDSTIRRSDMTSLRTILTVNDLKEATVVSRSSGEIQVLHPDNYSTLDLRVPDGAEIGETVKVASVDGVLYYVPHTHRRQ